MSVSIEEKRAFLNQFLKRYKLQTKECRWILEYIANNSIIENVHFVETIVGYETAFMMSTECDYELPSFSGIIQGSSTVDSGKMFHFIRLNDGGEIYIQLNFKAKMKDDLFVGVLEENKNFAEKENSGDTQFVNKFLDHMLLKFRPTELLIKIDLAIEAGNKERFIDLSNTYKEMKELERKSKETS